MGFAAPDFHGIVEGAVGFNVIDGGAGTDRGKTKTVQFVTNRYQGAGVFDNYIAQHAGVVVVVQTAVVGFAVARRTAFSADRTVAADHGQTACFRHACIVGAGVGARVGDAETGQHQPAPFRHVFRSDRVQDRIGVGSERDRLLFRAQGADLRTAGNGDEVQVRVECQCVAGLDGQGGAIAAFVDTGRVGFGDGAVVLANEQAALEYMHAIADVGDRQVLHQRVADIHEAFAVSAVTGCGIVRPFVGDVAAIRVLGTGIGNRGVVTGGRGRGGCRVIYPVVSRGWCDVDITTATADQGDSQHIQGEKLFEGHSNLPNRGCYKNQARCYSRLVS